METMPQQHISIRIQHRIFKVRPSEVERLAGSKQVLKRFKVDVS